jgi:GAF domain-containing protein
VDDRVRNVLAELAQATSDLGSALEPPGFDDLLTTIAETARDVLGAAACSIAVVDPAEEELVFVAAAGAGADVIRGTRMPGGSGIAGWVLASGQSILVTDPARDPRFAEDVAKATGYLPHTLLAVPLESEGESIGVMEILDPKSIEDESPLDSELLSLLAQQATMSIQSSLLFEEMGRAVFAAGARALEGHDLAGALREAAKDAPGPRKELADLLAILYEFARLGPEERAAAVRILSAFLGYAREAKPLL